jgi:membrane-bound lytic murein transglycosylase B
MQPSSSARARGPALAWAALATCAALALVPPAEAGKRRAAREALPAVTYADRAEAREFALQLARKHGFEVPWVLERIGQARLVPAVRRLIMPPAEATAKNWAAYRERFIEPQRIAAGLAFWAEHERWLARAEALYGVPAQLVVGIIGVETYYGRHVGAFRVIDALATLAFDFPPGRSDRSAFFRDELEALFVLGRTQGIDPLDLRGSYAGAIGLPQFMPSSWNRHAIDFDGDGRADLQRSTADVVGSVAAYLAAFGWTPGLQTHFAVTPPADEAERAVLLAPDIRPSFTADEFKARGAMLDAAAQAYAGPLALVELFNGDAAPSYVAGTSNFYTVTRYNWSSYYAMAVIELGEAIAQVRGSRLTALQPP